MPLRLSSLSPLLLVRWLLSQFLPPSVHLRLSLLAPPLSHLSFSPLLSLALISSILAPLLLKVRILLPISISSPFLNNHHFLPHSVHPLSNSLTQPTSVANSPSFMIPFISLTSAPLPTSSFSPSKASFSLNRINSSFN